MIRKKVQKFARDIAKHGSSVSQNSEITFWQGMKGAEYVFVGDQLLH